MSFADLGLAPELLVNLQRLKYTVATPIQTATIPLILDGHDVLGCAQTGTGKTAAFSLPILQQLLPEVAAAPPTRAAANAHGRAAGRRSESEGKGGRAANHRPIAALVLTPTRELASQIAESFTTYGKNLGLRQAVIYGGVSANPQMAQLRNGVDIVVATPGRLLDLMGQNVVDLSRLRVLVLDEADQMLDMGFIQPLKRIVSRIPRDRQTLMFSATMPPEIQRLAEQWLQDPHIVQANVVARPPDKIRQSVAFVDQKRKIDALIEYVHQSAGIRQIVFCRTKHGADRLAKQLSRADIPAVAIHGNKSQNARQRALASFSSEEPPILVATDVAARGLHMPGVSHVINYDLPNTPETYVHRIGRTARAGATGESISFCSPDERESLRDIERLIGHSIAIHSLSDQSLSRSTSTADDHRPASGRPASGRPASGRPGSGRPASGRPASGRAGSGRSGSGRPVSQASHPSPKAQGSPRKAVAQQESSHDRPSEKQRRGSSTPDSIWMEVGPNATRRPKPRPDNPRRSSAAQRPGTDSRPANEKRMPAGQSGSGQRPATDRRSRSEQTRSNPRPTASQRPADGQRPSDSQRPSAGQKGSAGQRAAASQRGSAEQRPSTGAGQRSPARSSGGQRSWSATPPRPRPGAAPARPRRRQTD